MENSEDAWGELAVEKFCPLTMFDVAGRQCVTQEQERKTLENSLLILRTQLEPESIGPRHPLMRMANLGGREFLLRVARHNVGVLKGREMEEREEFKRRSTSMLASALGRGLPGW